MNEHIGTIENPNRQVWIRASQRVLDDLLKGWSSVVRAHATENADGSWEITFCAPNPQRSAQIDAIWPPDEIPKP